MTVGKVNKTANKAGHRRRSFSFQLGLSREKPIPQREETEAKVWERSIQGVISPSGCSNIALWFSS